jgi:two-component system, OmpR family, sensor kinase
LALIVLALLAVSSLIAVVALRQLLLSRVGDRVDAALEQEVRELRRLASLGRDPRTGRPFGSDIRALFEVFLARNVPAQGEEFYTLVSGRPFRSSAAAEPDPALAARLRELGAITESARDDVETGEGDIRYLAVPVRLRQSDPGVFAVTFRLEDEREEVADAVRIAAGVSIIVFVGAAIAVFSSVGGMLAPVRELTRTARSITESDLSRRIEVRGNDEIAELARTFNEMLDRLSAAFGSQREFLSAAGHELRTPITIVRGHLEVMGDDPEERLETIALVTDELDRMARLVDELLLLARAQRPGFLRLERISLADLAGDLLAKARALAPREWRLERAGDGTIEADGQRLTQAVLNLAQNAVDHTGEGDEIELGVQRRDAETRIWVRDSGAGVAHEDQGRIFERFERGRGRRGGDGLGLGLALVKAIAEGHGGRVEVSSRLGSGAVFTLVLPTRRVGR